jgi:hypothetical protein
LIIVSIVSARDGQRDAALILLGLDQPDRAAEWISLSWPNGADGRIYALGLITVRLDGYAPKRRCMRGDRHEDPRVTGVTGCEVS